MKAKMCLLTLIRFSFLNNSFLRNLGIVLTKVLCKGIMQALMFIHSFQLFLLVFMSSASLGLFLLYQDKRNRGFGAYEPRQDCDVANFK